jgi:hypothetical protein
MARASANIHVAADDVIKAKSGMVALRDAIDAYLARSFARPSEAA